MATEKTLSAAIMLLALFLACTVEYQRVEPERALEVSTATPTPSITPDPLINLYKDNMDRCYEELEHTRRLLSTFSCDCPESRVYE